MPAAPRAALLLHDSGALTARALLCLKCLPVGLPLGQGPSRPSGFSFHITFSAFQGPLDSITGRRPLPLITYVTAVVQPLRKKVEDPQRTQSSVHFLKNKIQVDMLQ